MSDSIQNELKNLVDQVTSSTFDRFASMKLDKNELALTVGKFVDSTYYQADYRGDELIYPASIVKLFYLVAAHRWLEDGKIEETPELLRAMKDMIEESSNDATHYVLDVITGTTSGPELPEEQMSEWIRRRNVVNDYFRLHGFDLINLNQKPWGDGPYGRERMFLGEGNTNRNMLTTNLTAKLLSEIVQKRLVSEPRSERMLQLLKRDKALKEEDPDDQATKFSAAGLTPGYRLWSKAGWTSVVRHDAAYVERANGDRFIMVIFTANHARNYELIPYIAKEINSRI